MPPCVAGRSRVEDVATASVRLLSGTEPHFAFESIQQQGESLSTQWSKLAAQAEMRSDKLVTSVTIEAHLVHCQELGGRVRRKYETAVAAEPPKDLASCISAEKRLVALQRDAKLLIAAGAEATAVAAQLRERYGMKKDGLLVAESKLAELQLEMESELAAHAARLVLDTGGSYAVQHTNQGTIASLY